jgi:hypothetical protein
MQQTTELTVPRPRAQPYVDVEHEVARLADLVLKLAALAQRYEDAMGRIPPAHAAFGEQQERVDTLRDAADRGRRRLTALGRS